MRPLPRLRIWWQRRHQCDVCHRYDGHIFELDEGGHDGAAALARRLRAKHVREAHPEAHDDRLRGVS